MKVTTGSIEQSLRRVTVNAPKKALVQIATALDFLHSSEICHGEIQHW